MPKPDLVSAAEACQMVGVDRSTLLRWAKSGRLRPAMQVGSGKTGAYLFRRSDVKRLAAKSAA